MIHGPQVSENDDVLSMWSPDALPTPPQYALRALLTMFATLGAFSGLVYMSLPDAPAVPRGFPYDGLVRELSGTDDEQFAVSTMASSSGRPLPPRQTHDFRARFPASMPCIAVR